MHLYFSFNMEDPYPHSILILNALFNVLNSVHLQFEYQDYIQIGVINIKSVNAPVYEDNPYPDIIQSVNGVT